MIRRGGGDLGGGLRKNYIWFLGFDRDHGDGVIGFVLVIMREMQGRKGRSV